MLLDKSKDSVSLASMQIRTSKMKDDPAVIRKLNAKLASKFRTIHELETQLTMERRISAKIIEDLQFSIDIKIENSENISVSISLNAFPIIILCF